jgi:alpha-tubulin suppressor-like RCC1 family protein
MALSANGKLVYSGQGETISADNCVETKRLACAMKTEVKDFSISSDHLLVVDKDGNLLTTGKGETGALGDNTFKGRSDLKKLTSIKKKVVSIATNNFASACVTEVCTLRI